MNNEYWLEVISRLSAVQITDLDDILSPPGRCIPATGLDADLDRVLSRPSRELWADRKSGVLAIGISISKPLRNPVNLAGHLAAMAVERGIIPIVLSEIGLCGLERFGFRVEDVSQMSGGSADELKDQIRQFWHIDIMIDADSITSYS